MKRLKVLTPLISFIAVAAVTILPASASAAYLHNTVTASFGPNGVTGGGGDTFGGINRLAFQQASKRLYVLDSGSNKIYGFDTSTPGTYTPLTGNFAGGLGVTSAGGDPEIAVDNTGLGSAGNLYYVSESNGLYGFSPTGSQIFSVSRSSFGDPCGVATDSTGHSWVVDYSSRRLFEFPAIGGTAIGSLSLSGAGICHSAGDPVNGDLYVAEYSGPTYRYTAASGYATKILIDPSGTKAITVDALTHDVYVVHSTKVDKYNPSGGLIEEFATGVGGSLIGAAVDGASGTVYLAQTSTNKILVLPGAVVPDLTTSDSTGFATLHGHVDPAGGGDVTDCHFQFATDVAYTQNVGTKACTPTIPPNYSGQQDVTADLTGLVTSEQTYHYRLVASNANGTDYSADQTFTPHFVAGLKTDPADPVTRNGATLNGEFFGTNDDTNYYFEWGTSSGTYTHQSATPPGDNAGKTTGDTPLTYTISGLSPSTTYYYRVVASNSQGTSLGNEVSFTTPPAVTDISTDPAANVAPTSATLNGSFTGDGTDTHYYFEWGTNTSYGQTSAVPPGTDALSPTGPTSILFDLTGLSVETTYHYRIVATNTFGTSYGQDQNFTTPPAVNDLSTDPPTNPVAGSETLNASYTGDGNDTHYYFQYGIDTSYHQTTAAPPGTDAGSGTGPQTVSAIASVVPYTSYHYRVVATNIFGTTFGSDRIFFSAPPALPTIDATSSSAVAQSAATLNAQINPGFGDTVYRFQYGANTSYGSSTLVSDSLGSDGTDHPASADVTGLTPGTTYHYRAVAINFSGTTHGPDRTFTTSDVPTVIDSASGVTQSSATLAAQINPRLAATTYHLEYGTDASYGSRTPESSTIGSDNTAHPASVTLTGLSPATTYHYRAIATNVNGATGSPDQTFTTAASNPVVVPPTTCKTGFVKKQGKCVRKQHHKRHHKRHHSRSGRHG